jgi:transcriptional regulator NrdR family protein
VNCPLCQCLTKVRARKELPDGTFHRRRKCVNDRCLAEFESIEHRLSAVRQPEVTG